MARSTVEGKLPMTFWQMLWRVELRALVALLICAFLMALYGLVDSLRASAAGSAVVLTPLDAAWSLFLYTLVFGLLPAAIYGAPVYTLLRHNGLASWLTVVLIGAAPSVVMFLIGERDLKSDMTGWFLICGVAVACLTHALSSDGPLQLAKQSSHSTTKSK